MQGKTFTFGRVTAEIIKVMLESVTAIAAAVFLVGALLYGASFGIEDHKNKGKAMMIGAIVGLLLVVGARGILGLTLYFVYGDRL